jgi:hypothetical protein
MARLGPPSLESRPYTRYPQIKAQYQVRTADPGQHGRPASVIPLAQPSTRRGHP